MSGIGAVQGSREDAIQDSIQDAIQQAIQDASHAPGYFYLFRDVINLVNFRFLARVFIF